jgi:hypothetical protein
MTPNYPLTSNVLEAIWESLSKEQQDELNDFIESNITMCRTNFEYFSLKIDSETTTPSFNETEKVRNSDCPSFAGIYCEACGGEDIDEVDLCNGDLDYPHLEHVLAVHFPHLIPEKEPTPLEN